jgi:hypothetical protein
MNKQHDKETMLAQITNYRKELIVGQELPCPYLVSELDRVRRYSKAFEGHEWFEDWFTSISAMNNSGVCAIATQEHVDRITFLLDCVELVINTL